MRAGGLGRTCYCEGDQKTSKDAEKGSSPWDLQSERIAVATGWKVTMGTSQELLAFIQGKGDRVVSDTLSGVCCDHSKCYLSLFHS